jgi:hypothetical protein
MRVGSDWSPFGTTTPNRYDPGMVRAGLSLVLGACASLASAQYLFWHPEPRHAKYTAIYGEITVLADNPGVYYCGCDWWPSAKAGGYTGIQDLRKDGKRILLSVWDTSPELHASLVTADARVTPKRFEGEGHGFHTRMQYDWRVGKTYLYYVTKRPDQTGANTLVTLYFFDETRQQWVGEGRIFSPGGHRAVDNFDTNLNSFLENLRDKNDKQREVPKVAVYSLWAGTGPDDLHMITTASGKAQWGTVGGSFFLAEGDDAAVRQVLSANAGSGGTYEFGAQKAKMQIPSRTLPEKTLDALRTLP